MSITNVNPYLNFNGTASKAIKVYESALGAKVESVMPFGDKGPPGTKDRIMHATLRLGGGVIMLSDTMPDMPPPAGNNVHVSLNCSDAAEMEKQFSALAVDGQVRMPLADQFWGARFGMLTDAFGINWMFNCELKKG
ncbi:MAG TPA: VOC family protein [Polyangia bacterium]|jgi:PhnB protein|nr:VOC family protein [Polyangia bacterium]